MSLTKELKERGFIHQSTTENIEDVFDKSKRTIYHGIDPSANSAHAGNFVLWVFLKHLADAGHKIIFLVGGATGMIGDPKPNAERMLLTPEVVQGNVEALKTQAENFFGGTDIEFVNNYDWFESIKLIDFLRDVGKHFTVNELIKRDAISKRLATDTGLSYTEFAYPLIQGFDFLQLYKEKGCTVQIGGSDQWGNIVSGVDLIRRKEQVEVYAVTTPLVTDKTTGKKFGKSEGNAVWLDGRQTSPYKFYQFWLNTSDDSVIDYLKLFTFINLNEIEEIRQNFEVNPGQRVAQKELALKVTELVHGDDLAKSAAKVSDILFSGSKIESLSDLEVSMLLETAPSSELSGSINVVDLLVDVKLATSKREAKMFIESGAVEIAGEKVDEIDFIIEKNIAKNNLIVVKRGKKQVHIMKVV